MGMAMVCASCAVLFLGSRSLQGPAEIAIGAMLAVAGIWLLFGVRTRVMAVIATVLISGHAVLVGAATPVPDAMPLLAAVLSLPLALFGGGPFALYSKGWREIF
ncbi:hypothetical protein GCM10011392_20300 [Wenxinia marina]|nr:hypothetical protein GCM10011392_20300 [Wenxinia marina]